MIVMLGDTRKSDWLPEIRRRGWGRMVIDKPPKIWPGEPWGFDNGAYSAWRAGRPFPAEEFSRRLEVAQRIAGTPYLSVTPDIVAGGLRSLEFSLRWLKKLPAEWPWYLAVQDGMQPSEVASVLEPFTGIFLGGTARFKSTAWQWRSLALEHGKKFHFARASVLSRIELARICQADSLDTAFPLWTAQRFREFLALFDGEPRQSQIVGTLAALRGA
jgi:hypothetical protein